MNCGSRVSRLRFGKMGKLGQGGVLRWTRSGSLKIITITRHKRDRHKQRQTLSPPPLIHSAQIPFFQTLHTILTDGRNECRIEGVLGESKEYACFSDTWITNQQQLEQVVVRLGHYYCGVRCAFGVFVCCWLMNAARGRRRAFDEMMLIRNLFNGRWCPAAAIRQHRVDAFVVVTKVVDEHGTQTEQNYNWGVGAETLKQARRAAGVQRRPEKQIKIRMDMEWIYVCVFTQTTRPAANDVSESTVMCVCKFVCTYFVMWMFVSDTDWLGCVLGRCAAAVQVGNHHAKCTFKEKPDKRPYPIGIVVIGTLWAMLGCGEWKID